MRLFLLIVVSFSVLAFSGCHGAQWNLEKGDGFFVRKNYALALEHYLNAQKKDPTLIGIDKKINQAEIRLQLQKGDDAKARGEWVAAERAYIEVHRLDPNNTEVGARMQDLAMKRANVHFRKGQQLLGRGNPFDAIAEFEEALTFHPEHPRATQSLERAIGEKRDRVNQSEEAFEQGMRSIAVEEFDEAMQHFASALNLNPHHPGAARERERTRVRFAEKLVFEADAAMSRGQWPRAVEIYRKAQAQHPALPGLPQKLRKARRESRAAKLIAEANTAFGQGDWEVAFDRYETALEFTSEQKDFKDRLKSSRENLAAQLYRDAQADERKNEFDAALTKYRKILVFYTGYRNVEQHADKLNIALVTAKRAYNSGCRAQEENNLRVAREQFRICSEMIASYKDVVQRRHKVEQDFKQAQKLYQRAVQAQQRREWDRARILFEEALSMANPLRDATERLDQVRNALMDRADMQDKYANGIKAQSERNYRSAKKFFDACKKTQPDYRDIAARLQEIESSLQTAQSLYDRGMQAEKSGNLKRARTLLEECVATCTPFLDVEERLKRVQKAATNYEEARKLEGEKRLFDALEKYKRVLADYAGHSEARGSASRIQDSIEQLKTSYTSMLDAQRRGKYDVALKYGKQIRAQCRGYRDVDTRVLLLESEVEYAAGSKLEEQGNFEEALTHFENCARRSPNFRDVRGRVRACREQVALTR